MALLKKAAGNAHWTREALAIAEAVTRIGNPDLAREIARAAKSSGRFEVVVALAGTSPWSDDEALLAELWAIGKGYDHDSLLTAAVSVAAEAGRIDRVRRLAEWTPQSESRARLFACAAERMEPAAARELITAAFPQGRWTHPLLALADVQPSSIPALVEEFDDAYGRIPHPSD